MQNTTIEKSEIWVKEVVFTAIPYDGVLTLSTSGYPENQVNDVIPSTLTHYSGQPILVHHLFCTDCSMFAIAGPVDLPSLKSQIVELGEPGWEIRDGILWSPPDWCSGLSDCKLRTLIRDSLLPKAA